MPRRHAPHEYLTSSEAARIIGCSVGMVYSYERTGRLHKFVPPARKQGYFLRVEVEELAQALSSFFDRPTDQ